MNREVAEKGIPVKVNLICKWVVLHQVECFHTIDHGHTCSIHIRTYCRQVVHLEASDNNLGKHNIQQQQLTPNLTYMYKCV